MPKNAVKASMNQMHGPSDNGVVARGLKWGAYASHAYASHACASHACASHACAMQLVQNLIDRGAM